MPNIIGVCETKIKKNSNINFLTLNGYNFHFFSSMTNVVGVGIYVKNLIIYSIRQDLNFKFINYKSLW